MRNPFSFLFADDEPEIPTGEMTLVDHLKELRKRLIRSVIGVFVGCVLVYIFRETLFDFLKAPYCDFQESNDAECSFLIREPLEGFSATLSLVGYGGLILAFPVILYQMGRFVMPGLYPHEKKALLPFLGISVILLALGMTVAYLVLPRALEVLINDFGFEGFDAQFSPKAYVGFFVKMLFAFGIAAELPIVLVFLQKVGVVHHTTLSKNRRLAAVAVVILGAVITPTGDPFTLAVISVPMYIFYEISILVGKRMQGPRQPVGAGV